MTNLFQTLTSGFSQQPERVAFHLPDRADWSYGDLLTETQKLAAALTQNDVKVGDRVLVQVEKSPEAVALYLATLQIGAVFVPLNTAYTGAEVAYFIDNAAPSLVVTEPAALSALTELAGGTRRTMTLLGGPTESCLHAGAQALAPLPTIEPRTDDDLAALLYTSGTTGRSKGAMLTHANLASNALTLNDYWGWQDNDVLVHALPIFHVHGLFVALHCAFLATSAMHFLTKFDGPTVAGLLPSATVLMGVPTFYTRLLTEPTLNAELCRNMRLFISGSAPLTTQTFEAFEAATGHRILERYGMSETIMNTSNPLNGERVPGTVGFALPGIRVRVCAEDGTELAPDEIGGLEVTGPNVFSGYWQMPEKTAEEFRADGFFKTGDVAVMAADGRVSIVGRDKDMVITGGFNVYPKEVEALIDEMDDVVESAVIGVAHSDFGEGVVAVVVAQPGKTVTLDTVEQWVGERLARFKQPKLVVCVDELPRNAMGKVQKNVLRDQFAGLFDAHS